MSTNKADLDRAMQDALDSVEKREAEASAETDEGSNEEITALRAELGQKTADLSAMKDQLLRLGADFENLRKRSAREVDEARKFGVERFAREVLPVVDNLERALQHAKGGDPVVDGVKMVAKQFVDILSQFGVKSFEAVGKPFDPERHEALSQIPSPGAEPGSVIAEMQRGYMIHDRLLRAAQVAIAALGAEDEAAEEGSAEAKLDARKR